MRNFIIFLQGKKTYFLAAALLSYAIGGYFSGHLTSEEALKLIYESGIAASIRAAITKASLVKSTVELKDISDIPERKILEPGETASFSDSRAYVGKKI